MRYVASGQADRAALAAALAANDVVGITDGLLGLTNHDPDWRWVQEQCLALLAHPDKDVRGLAATCLGHLARIHRTIDLDKVVPALRQRSADPAIAGQIEDALEDIEMYVG
ncbi:MAG: hypothetical protein ABW224_00080 [Kibdelosporangium sp.]